MSPRTLLALALLPLLAACGKAGAPVVPNSPFPMMYPDPKLAPTAPVRAAPEDQAALQAGDKAKFTDKGSYIDPAVRATELQRGAVLPGSTLPYAQTYSSEGGNTPLSQTLGVPLSSPLPAVPGTAPNTPSTDPDQR
jgi:hypothetical protein